MIHDLHGNGVVRFCHDGTRGQQTAPPSAFRLEERVPAGHLLRRIDAVLDLSFVRERMAPHDSTIGRPSICPELMVRMLRRAEGTFRSVQHHNRTGSRQPEQEVPCRRHASEA